MHRYIAPILFVGLASCSASSSSTADSRLVGTWEVVMNWDHMIAKVAAMPGVKESADQIKTRLETELAKDGEQMPRTTFAADGQYVMEGSVFGHDARHESRWSIVEEDPKHAVIEIDDTRPGHAAEKEHWTFVFESADIIVDASSLMKGEKYRRVR